MQAKGASNIDTSADTYFSLCKLEDLITSCWCVGEEGVVDGGARSLFSGGMHVSSLRPEKTLNSIGPCITRHLAGTT